MLESPATCGRGLKRDVSARNARGTYVARHVRVWIETTHGNLIKSASLPLGSTLLVDRNANTVDMPKRLDSVG